ncbi:LysM domain-containing protein [Kalaharituber pfeilii]|nr:LysM domain-containing protein [Kalaharituber pfeilii]
MMLHSSRHKPRKSFCFAFLSLLQQASAVSFFTNATVPSPLSIACTNALLQDVSCSPVVAALQSGQYYPTSTLTLACTSACASALAAYQNGIASGCGNETWRGYEEQELPVLMIPDIMRYHYNIVCLQDSGRWCNNVAAQYAAELDPSASHPVTGEPVVVTNTTDPCDLCFIKHLRILAGSPYYDGPFLAEIYESKTSGCSVVGYPLTTTTLSFYTPIDPPDTDPEPCTGTEYTIAPGDTCHSISLAEGISTGWLLADNKLTANCVNFPTNGTLCIANPCTVYTVVEGDTCESIAAAHEITVSQFKAWNPSVSTSCSNLAKMVSHQVCVSVPGRPYTTPAPVTLAPSVPATPAPVPTDVANQTNTYCGRYYQAMLGDYCNMIVIKFGISLDDFVFLNPAINENCTNLFANESYCVQAVGDIATYHGHPRSALLTTVTSISITENVATLPDADYTTPAPRVTEAPIASGSRQDCAEYIDGDSMQLDLNGTWWESTCQFVAKLYGVSLEELEIWNPQLGNTTLSTCSFQTGVRYCAKYFFGESYVPPVVPEPELPIRDGTTPNCTEYLEVTEGWTCADILEEYRLTMWQFYTYNPAVLADCSGMWLNYRYCVRDPSYPDTSPTVTTVTPSPTAAGPPGPTQSGQPEHCNKWHIALKDVDTCMTITNTYFIDLAQFLEWNPAVSSDCSAGLWGTYAYCIGVADALSSTRVSSPTSPMPTYTPVPVPDPHQENNAISTCNKFGQAQEGDWCSLFAERNGITPKQLYAWNAVLGLDGSSCQSMLWATYWYCVGATE